MTNILSRTSRNARIGLLACLLGLVAAFAGSPYRGDRVTLDTIELANIVEREMDHVEAVELADWIIQGKTDYRLIDLGSEEEFGAYHIPGAENVTLTELPDYGLQRNEKIILYSGGGIHSAQAWFLLKAEGYKAVYILLGGLNAWKDTILFPYIPADPDPAQIVALEKMKEVSRFFGGSPRTGEGGTESMESTPLPKIESPVLPDRPAATQRKREKEGC